MANSVTILGICAAGSNTGKTTLINKLIAELGTRGIRVSVIKHAHHHFDIDHPGKDSYSMREAGAVQTLIASGKRWALMTEMQRTPDLQDEADLDTLIPLMNADYADIILVEGFKNANIPKIEVHRPSLGKPLLCIDDASIIAVASDAPVKLDPRAQLPVLDLNSTEEISDFILKFIAK